MEVYDEGNVGRWGCSSRLRNAVRLNVDTARCFSIYHWNCYMSLTHSLAISISIPNLFHDSPCIFNSSTASMVKSTRSTSMYSIALQSRVARSSGGGGSLNWCPWCLAAGWSRFRQLIQSCAQVPCPAIRVEGGAACVQQSPSASGCSIAVSGGLQNLVPQCLHNG